MKALIQRVTHASVVVDGDCVGEIDRGILLLLGVEKQDSEDTVKRAVDKVLGYRLFEDDAGKMNLSLRDVQGGLLVVSQFTIVADTKKGLRPSFSSGASPDQGKFLYDEFVMRATELYSPVQSGTFGADMKVSLLNDGPVTFMLDF